MELCGPLFIATRHWLVTYLQMRKLYEQMHRARGSVAAPPSTGTWANGLSSVDKRLGAECR